LTLAPASTEAKEIIGFKWAGGNIGSRNKLGGVPDWLQLEETPNCSCGKNMTFYGQLDSIGDAICLGDCGMIYVFICLDCFDTRAIFQCG
jgi:hypothetical protein